MDTETGPGKSKAPSHGEEWRWRIMSLTILPGKPFNIFSECGQKAAQASHMTHEWSR